MAYVYDNKTYRNLQQQVKENMENIAELQDLKLVGIDVAGIVPDYNSLPSSATQGQLYAVGTSSPYELYVYNNSSWVDFGEFPKAGPKGDQGPQGEPGRQGQRGLTGPQGQRGYTGATGAQGPQGPSGERGPKGDKGDTGLVDAFAKDSASITAVGQAYVDENGYLQVCTSLSPLTFSKGALVKGPKGDQGEQGEQGIQGPEGPQGPKGEQGDPSSIKVNGNIYTRDDSGLITLPGFITDASLANYLEKDTFKPIEWSKIDHTDSSITHKLKLNLRPDSDEYFLRLENYKNASLSYGVHMSEEGMFVFKDNGGANKPQSILSYDSLILSDLDLDLSQSVAFHTDYIRINDTKNIPYADIATVSQIPTKTSQLNNDSGFVRGKDLIGYATKTWVEEQGYLNSVAWGDIADKPTFATVATSGSYNDLWHKPTIPTKTSQLTNNSGFITSTELATKQDKLTAGTGITIDENNVISSSGGGSVNWSDILNKPTFATVATSGSYNDLSDKPIIPTVDYPVTDVTVGGVSVLSNKVAVIPALFDGNYNSLENKPDLSVYALSSSLSTVATSGSYNDLSDKPTLATVATTGAYSDLTGTPTIPTKTSQLTNDSNFITNSALSGYATETWVGEQDYATNTALTSGLATKQDTISDLSTIRSGAAAGATAVQPTALSEYAKTSELATVATSGSYTDLTNKPTIPTTTGELTNDSGFITSTALSGYATTSDVSTAISNQTKETWTFTLSDGSTVTKTVVLG